MNVTDILKKAANEAGIDSFDELPVVAAVVVRDPTLGSLTWSIFKPVPIRKEMLVVAMFQDGDVIRVYAWPTVDQLEGQKLLPTRYTLRAEGNIPVVTEWMSAEVANDQLVWEIGLMVGDDGDDESDEPEESEATVVAPSAPPAEASTTNGAPTF